MSTLHHIFHSERCKLTLTALLVSATLPASRPRVGHVLRGFAKAFLVLRNHVHVPLHLFSPQRRSRRKRRLSRKMRKRRRNMVEVGLERLCIFCRKSVTERLNRQSQLQLWRLVLRLKLKCETTVPGRDECHLLGLAAAEDRLILLHAPNKTLIVKGVGVPGCLFKSLHSSTLPFPCSFFFLTLTLTCTFTLRLDFYCYI